MINIGVGIWIQTTDAQFSNGCKLVKTYLRFALYQNYYQAFYFLYQTRIVGKDLMSQIEAAKREEALLQEIGQSETEADVNDDGDQAEDEAP